MRKILITGGTGVLGSAVMKQLQLHKEDFLCVSRKPFKQDTYDTAAVNNSMAIPWERADLIKGTGIKHALSNTQTLLHLASSMETFGKEPAEVIAARNLLEASGKADIRHFIYISIVGIDKIPSGYYEAKLKVEEMIAQSGIPYTILRSTQFHNFMDFQISKMLRFPIGFVPKKLKFQPIQVEALAKELFRLTQDIPQNQVINIGGKQVLELGEMVHLWLKKREKHKPVINLPIMGGLMHAFAKGYGTCSEISAHSNTWDEYVSRKYSPKKLQMEAFACIN